MAQGVLVTKEIDPRFWHEGRQSRNEIHWVEGRLRGAIPVGRLQGLENLAGGAERKVGGGDSGAWEDRRKPVAVKNKDGACSGMPVSVKMTSSMEE
jgi:hypothetical protein